MLVRSSHPTFAGETLGLTAPCTVQVLGGLVAQLGAAWRSPPQTRCLRRSGRSQRVKSSVTATRYCTGALTDARASAGSAAGCRYSESEYPLSHRKPPRGPRPAPFAPTLSFLSSGMNPMTNSRNCTCQQSSVNRRDQGVCTKVSVQNMTGSHAFCMHAAIIELPRQVGCSALCTHFVPKHENIYFYVYIDLDAFAFLLDHMASRASIDMSLT